MSSEAYPVLTDEQLAVQHLKAIAKAISQLEGLPVNFTLAKQLGAVQEAIQIAIKEER